ncbi:hypothetical protein WAI453_009154 [Rhynchosporium graminicola]
MPPKTNLRGFLRKDIRRNKITTAPLKGRTLAFPKPVTEEANELDYPFDEDITESKENNPGSKPDSMSVKPIVKEMTMEQKPNLDEFSRCLPACTSEEKNTTKAKAKQIAKAFAGFEVNSDHIDSCIVLLTLTSAKKTPSKRNRENTDNDLDGEERLRMGKSYKRPAMEVTGHWGMTVHDYFPDFEGNGLDRDALTAEEKLLNRRELAELGEALAKAERKKRLLEK